MLYHIDFRLEYPGTMSQKELFSIWSEEAHAAMDAKKAGIIVNLWKCVGTRRVIAIVNVESPDQLDQIMLDLPIMKKLGFLTVVYNLVLSIIIANYLFYATWIQN
ncbi:MAG: muconolactone Delta-isomerase family protein [Microcoleaceae cyanobacterium]